MASSTVFPFGQDIVWHPDPDQISTSNLARFMHRNGIASYPALLEKARGDVGWFWNAVMEDLDVQFYAPYTQVYQATGDPAFPRWCVGGRLNIVHNLLDKWQQTEVRDRIALRWEGEEGVVETYTYAELYRQVCKCAGGLRALGLGKGDAVGLFMPMTPQLVIAFLATIKIGGVILPLFSGYGPDAVATRLRDGNARALFTSNAVYRRGKTVPLKPTADEALAEVPSVAHVIVHERVGNAETTYVEGRDVRWDDLLRDQPTDVPTEQTDAEDVVMIIYTSGTTGKPKGAVHTHCGFPIKGAQDLYHCMDLKPGETLYWMTDMGWMMGPWLVFGTLLVGATMVLFDGAPDYPDVDRLWQMVEKHGITHLGVSPTLMRVLRTHGTEPLQKYDRSSLRLIGSTGSPWDVDSWMWTFQHVLDGRKPILNYSGGTEISGGILCGNLYTPLKPCAFSGPVPGMDADVVDAEGQSVRGEVGELVVRQPWIGMTRGFWNDADRYLDSYWRRFPGVWVHGDFAAIDRDNLWYILGRSDDTIKVAGKRLGPAEVEGILNAHPDVRESAAIGVPHDVKGEEVVAFVVLREGVAFSDALRMDLLGRVAAALGKPLKPREIRFTNSLPKTRNAKVLRRLIRATYLDIDTGDTTSLEFPEALDDIRASH